MEDSELQRILAETVGESTRGVEALPTGDDDDDAEMDGVEVTVEDLVFTLRQIA